MELVFQMEIGEISQCPVYNPFHARHTTSVFQFNAKDEMAISRVRINPAVGHLDLELFQ
jgi:hypothetical protein